MVALLDFLWRMFLVVESKWDMSNLMGVKHLKVAIPEQFGTGPSQTRSHASQPQPMAALCLASHIRLSPEFTCLTYIAFSPLSLISQRVPAEVLRV
jgi:hypothetical protein